MKKLIFNVLTVLFLLGVVSTSQAALLSRAGGTMFYDTDLDITWLADANYAKTSGYDADGLMSWDESMTWVGSLVFGGFDGWRLPTSDSTCLGSNCTGSEMGHLYYTELGNTAHDPNYNKGSFINIVSTLNPYYWSATQHIPETGVWVFLFDQGGQTWVNYPNNMYWLPSWAVADGDIAAVPEPGTYLLLGTGLFVLGFLNKKRRKTGNV